MDILQGNGQPSQGGHLLIGYLQRKVIMPTIVTHGREGTTLSTHKVCPTLADPIMIVKDALYNEVFALMLKIAYSVRTVSKAA